MAWDDAGNLWWLKPQPDNFNPMQGIAAGMQMVQQNREQTLRMKQLALQQQTRNDMLEWRNKQVDQEIRDYNFKKQQAQDEMDDMAQLSKWMPEIRNGINIPISLKTYNGQKAYEGILNQVSLAKSREKMNATWMKNQQDTKETWSKMAAFDPALSNKYFTRFMENGGKWTPEDDAEIRAWWESTGQAKEAERMKAMGLEPSKTTASGAVAFAAPKDTAPASVREMKMAFEWEDLAKQAESAGDNSLAERYRNAATALKNKVERKPQELTSVRTLSKADEWLQEAADAEAAGDLELAKSLRDNANLLKGSIAPKGMEFEITSPDGTTTRFTSGGTKPDKPALTTAVSSQVQQRKIGAQGALEEANALLRVLNPKDVGVQGWVNQVAINEGLAQFFPQMKVGGVTQTRTLMGQFREKMMKMIASDPRISDRDVKRYEAILPKLGPVESVQSARDKIGQFMVELRRSVRIDAENSKVPVPDWAMTLDEIGAALKENKISQDRALEIIKNYFTNEEGKAFLK